MTNPDQKNRDPTTDSKHNIPNSDQNSPVESALDQNAAVADLSMSDCIGQPVFLGTLNSPKNENLDNDDKGSATQAENVSRRTQAEIAADTCVEDLASSRIVSEESPAEAAPTEELPTPSLPELIEPPLKTLTCRWRGEDIPLRFTMKEFETATITDLRVLIYEQLSIPVARQKFLQLKCDDLSENSHLRDCRFELGNGGFYLVGTPEAEQLPEEVVSAMDEALETYNSLEAQKRAFRLLSSPEVLESLEQATKKCHIRWIREPRPGRRLLILDIDYTLYDCKGGHVHPISEVTRPYLDQFLDAIWDFYDFAIWSQTRWQWVEMKCTELGLLTDPEKGPCFTLDKTMMVPVKVSASGRKGLSVDVKALKVVWEKVKKKGKWNSTNTLMVDDLPRNFLLNPSNGVRVKPFLRENRDDDRELLLLSQYLVLVATSLEDVTEWDHSQWRSKTCD